MAIQGFFTGDVKIRDLNGVLKAVDGIVEVATDAGTVTSVGIQVGSTGTDVNVANSPVTTSGNITLNLPTASATNRGLLSSADWAIFDAKQGSITLTTTGNNGSATLTSGTLNIPTYTLAGLGGISLTSLSASSPLIYDNTTGAFSIQVANGSQNGYLSSSDWTTFNSKQGALTFSSPLVNTAGTVSIPAATSSVNGYLTSADWTTFNAKQGAITLTTTGSSGAATLISNVLNIPNYSGALTGYVPYVGATANVDLGEFELKAGQFTLDISPTGTAAVGTTRWNNTTGTSETTLKGGTVILKNGVDLVARVVNKVFPNATLTKAAYQAVRVSGAQGQRLAVSYAQADGDPNSADTIGLVTETIATNQEGFIMTVGQLEGINTTGSLQGETWTDGDVLYLSPTIPGAITNIKPSAPQHLVVMGYVEYSHANNGKIYVKIMNGWELGELHDVNTTGAVNGSVLKYNGTIWVPSSDTGITSLNGLTALSQSFATGTSGTDFNISSATATHTFNLPTASATNRGALSSADWTRFNNNIPAGTPSVGDYVFYNGSNLAYRGLIANAPLSYNSSTATFSISQATTSTDGYLSSTDWNTFNNKQAAGNYITALTGEATASGPGSASVTLSTSAVTGKLLTGLNLTGGGTIAATDSILQAFGKVQNQISGMVGGVTFQGVWDASTNTPTLTSSVGTKGYYYIVSVAGSTNLNGITDWKVGDWAIFNGTTWDKVDNTDAVSSVNGFTGAVSLTTANISEVTNLYYLDSRARAAISLTTTGTSGAATYDNTTGVLNIPQYQSVLTNPITGTGTTNTLPKFTAASTIGNSNITDTGSLITLGSNTRINTGQDGLRIGADSDGVINSANTSKRGRINVPQYGNPSSLPVGIITGFTDVSSNSIDIGGTQGGYALASDVIKFFIGATYNATSQTEIARFASNGALGIGTTSLTGYSLRVSKNITGSVSGIGIQSAGAIQSDVTSDAAYFSSGASTQATTFTITDLAHFLANQGTFGAGSTVTKQYGFRVAGSLTGATNNYAFFSDIASGANRWNLYMNGTANNYMAGSLGIGTTSLSTANVRISKSMSGSTTYNGVLLDGQIQSDNTNNANYFSSVSSSQAATFTVNNVNHFTASQGTFGAGSTITTQRGFWAGASLIGATNNYGFQGSIPSGSNRWNIYMDGTANNYMAGALNIGTTTLSGYKLDVNGTARVSGLITGSDGATFGNTVNITRGFSTATFNVGDGGTTNSSTIRIIKNATGNAANLYFRNVSTDFTRLWLNASNNFEIANQSTSGLFATFFSGSNNIGIGTGTDVASSILTIDSTTKGVLFPRMTTTQKTAISSPATGLVVYDTTLNKLSVYTGAAWETVTSL